MKTKQELESKKDSPQPMQSKKFLAYLISEMTTKLAMFYMLYHLGSKLDLNELLLLTGMLISSSALTIGFVLGVASLEKYLAAAVDIVDKEDQKLKKELEELKKKNMN
jgi:hypothetical protein